MKNKRLFILAFVVILALVLGACTRSASTPVAPEATYPVPPDSTNDVTQELMQSGTATAIAESGAQSEQPEGEVTPEASEPQQPAEQEDDAAQQPEEQQEQPQPTQAPTVQQSYSVPDTYTLQKGEFPYCIARRFNINAQSLLSVNGLTASSLVYPGHVLTIPKDAGPFVGERSLRPHGTYVIQPGDTVYSIACLYGDVDPRAIEDANNLTGAYSLDVGSELIIP